MAVDAGPIDYLATRAARWQDLRREVEGLGGVAVYKMERLRDLDLSGRLGPHVLTRISSDLKRAGLGHQPRKLPSYQWEDVLIFTLGSPAETLVKAVLAPSVEGAAAMRRALEGGREEIELLQQMRELLDR